MRHRWVFRWPATHIFTLTLKATLRCLDTASAGLTLTYHDFAGHAARLAVRMAALGVVSHDTTVAVSVPR